MEQKQQFIDYIEQSIIQNWDRNALTDYKGATLQYKDVARKIAKFHIVLESANIKPGDKIAVCGRNSAHWAVTFLATLTYGAVIVPILHEFKADNIHNIVNHSEAKLLFVGDQIWENLNEDAMPLLLGIVLMPDFNPVVCRDERLMEAFEHRNAIYGQRYPKNFRPEHICYRKEASPEELAVINYTSGTTGYSKGVMLPYRSLWSNIAYCHEMLPVRPGDHIVSMLPLGHVFGMVYDFLYGFSAGAHLYFLTRMPSPKIIAQSFAEIRPRVISCVPLIVEKIIKKDILPRVDNRIGKLLLRMPIINDHIERTTDKGQAALDAMEDLALALRGAGKGLLDAHRYAGEALHMLTRGQVKMNMEMLGSDAPLQKLGKIVNRLTVALIVAGLFVGSSMLSLSTMEPRLLGVPVLAFFGFLGAAILSVWVLMDIWRKK